MGTHKLTFLALSTFFFTFLAGGAILLSSAISPIVSIVPINQLAQVSGTATLCNTYTNTTTPPQGYGVAYNLFSAAKELILNVTCNTNASVTLESGTGQNTTYIWHQAYITKDSQTWNPITLSGTNTAGNGQWIIGTAQTTQPLTTTEQTTQNYYASYVCTYTNSSWKCGCSDSTCATPKWNLQGMRK